MSFVPLPVNCFVNHKFGGLVNYTEDLEGEPQSLLKGGGSVKIIQKLKYV